MFWGCFVFLGHDLLSFISALTPKAHQQEAMVFGTCPFGWRARVSSELIDTTCFVSAHLNRSSVLIVVSIEIRMSLKLMYSPNERSSLECLIKS